MPQDPRSLIAEAKYRYLRAVDTKDFDLMLGALTDDAVGSFNNGAYVASGRSAIVELNREHLIDDYISTHTALHPEVTLLHEDTAEVTWQLLTHALRPSVGSETVSRGFYRDTYRLEADGWRISSTASHVRSSIVQLLDPTSLSIHR